MICKVLILVLLNGQTWNFTDLSKLQAAGKSCQREYSQCLGKFVKKGKTNYHAECKREKK